VRVKAARGAIQLSSDSKAAMREAVPRLISAILSQNSIEFEALISILFTATPDLTSEFPAAAARSLPLGDVPLICATEIDVENSLPRVVRVLIHFETDLERNQITHIYLDGAEALRQDLAQ
jgi:chorismate mutase